MVEEGWCVSVVAMGWRSRGLEVRVLRSVGVQKCVGVLIIWGVVWWLCVQGSG